MLARLLWTRREERRWIRQAVREALADLERGGDPEIAPPAADSAPRPAPARRRRRRRAR